MKCPKCGHVYKDPLKVKGGKKSRRSLGAEEAREMVKVREEKRKKKEAQNGRT